MADSLIDFLVNYACPIFSVILLAVIGDILYRIERFLKEGK